MASADVESVKPTLQHQDALVWDPSADINQVNKGEDGHAKTPEQ